MFPSAGFKDFPDFYKSMVRPPFSSSDTPRSPIITKKKAVNGIKDLRSPKRHSGLSGQTMVLKLNCLSSWSLTA